MSSGTRLLHSQKSTALYLERARIRLDGGRVVYDKAEGIEEKVFNIPYANLAVLFLGQGTSLTQGAARLLSEEGVFVAFTGSGGSPLHYGSLTNYQVTHYMKTMYEISSCKDKSLQVAKMAMRERCSLIRDVSPKIWASCSVPVDKEDLLEFVGEFSSSVDVVKTGEALLGNEGAFTKELYAIYAEGLGISGFSRVHGERRNDTREAEINSRLDHGNYIAYGIAGSALWTLGIPVSLSFLHGKTRAGSLVFDLADIFKDAVVLPMAFGEHESDAAFRAALIDAMQDNRILKRCFDFIKRSFDEVG